MSNSNNCNISEKDCKKSKNYKRGDINDIAEACGIKGAVKVKSRDMLCDLIITKKQGKAVDVEEEEAKSPKRAKAPKKGKECNKITLENCTVVQLKLICSDEGIEKCAKNKTELIKHILDSRKNKKSNTKEDEEEEIEVEEPSSKNKNKLAKNINKFLRSIALFNSCILIIILNSYFQKTILK